MNNTNANGDRYVKRVNRTTFALYNDKALTDPVSSNGSYQGLASVKRVYYNYADPLVSGDKISNYDIASQQKPLYELGQVMIKLAPEDQVCSEITMDYLTNATVYFDVSNAVINLEDTYPIDFLYYVIAKAVQLFSQEVNDKEKYQTSSIEINQENKS